MEELNGKSKDILMENSNIIKKLFPEVVWEDKIDFVKLKEVLGGYIEDREERYGFHWKGKSKVIKLAQTPSIATLIPCREDSKNWDETQNLYIEGDNLEILKLLQKTYHNRVKMIYIDPPYNTGNDFVYSDDYKDNLINYIELTKQADEAGRSYGTNTETSGRYHTQWLNMMYPRLRLARNLLKDDGVIFISIDDNEVTNLRNICNEIFGETNFVEQLVWKRRATPPNDRVIGKNHEYILVYAKDKDEMKLYLQPRNEALNARYKNPDNDQRGRWVASDLSANGKGGRLVESCVFPITNPKTGETFNPPQNKCWLYNEEKVMSLMAEGRIGFRDNSGAPFLKRYLSEVRQGTTLPTILEKAGFSFDSAKEIKALFDKDVFEFTKPVSLMEILIRTGTKEEDIILDFFSGSSTTAHAVMSLNAEDGGKRKFIMVQLPEVTNEKSEAYKAGYKNICEIGKERIRRAGDKITHEKKDYEKNIGLDIGFRVFKLATSNLKKWSPSHDDLEVTLEDMIENFIAGRTEEDVLYEIMLKYGKDLTDPIEVYEVEGLKFFTVGLGSLLVCVGDYTNINIPKIIINIKKKVDAKDIKVVLKDNGFETDSIKTNTLQTLKINGIEDVVFI